MVRLPSLRRPVSGAAGRRFVVAAAGMLAVAVALRTLLVFAYAPAILNHPDEASYVLAAKGPLFSDFARPAGYSVFLRLAHFLSGRLSVTIVLQHLLGLATAWLVFAVARRAGAGRWAALIPATVVAWSGDQLYLEHVLLSDGLFITLLLLACLCALRVGPASREGASGRAVAWAVAAGGLAAAMSVVRTAGLLFAAALLVWLLTVAGTHWRQRLLRAGGAAIVCLVLLLGYALAQQGQTGVFGLSRFSGWPLYARVAKFADCRQFTPPPGTRGLCQSVPPSRRLGPGAYIWWRQSPAQRLFGAPPNGGGALSAFARAAILGQPGAYLAAFARDLALYFYPYTGTGAADYSLDRPAPAYVAQFNWQIYALYGRFRVRIQHSITRPLERWRGVVRIHPWMLALGLLLGLWGAVLAGRATREALVLLLSGGLALLVAGSAVTFYAFRYGIPAGVLLLIGGVCGGEVVLQRGRRRLAGIARARGGLTAPGARRAASRGGP